MQKQISMMFMINKTLVDSSVLIEYIKKNKTKLLLELISDVATEAYINETIISEFLFHFLSINGNISPRSLQSSKKIKFILENSSQYNLLSRFSFLPTDESLFQHAPDFMMKYNLLPNDAIILATCKIHNITQLASHDKDFKEACNGEGITLLTEE